MPLWQLVGHLCDNIRAHGDVSEQILNLTLRITSMVKHLPHPSGEDSEAPCHAIETGLLPTFRSPEEDAGPALLRLIAVKLTGQENTEYVD